MLPGGPACEEFAPDGMIAYMRMSAEAPQYHIYYLHCLRPALLSISKCARRGRGHQAAFISPYRSTVPPRHCHHVAGLLRGCPCAHHILLFNQNILTFSHPTILIVAIPGSLVENHLFTSNYGCKQMRLIPRREQPALCARCNIRR